jgi:hypothetical protein
MLTVTLSPGLASEGVIERICAGGFSFVAGSCDAACESGADDVAATSANTLSDFPDITIAACVGLSSLTRPDFKRIEACFPSSKVT